MFISFSSDLFLFSLRFHLKSAQNLESHRVAKKIKKIKK